MPVTLPAVGTVEALSSVQIRGQVTGQLTAIHFAEGQEVRQGQPLFSLDARPFEAALQQAGAVLARDIATAQNADAQQARIENLYQRGLIARDQYETQHSSAASLAATVAADKATVENVRLNLQYTEIKAPITGRTGSLAVHVGDVIRANDVAALVTINQLAPIYVTFSVPGRYLTDIRRYQATRSLRVSATAPTGFAPGAQGTGAAAPATTGAPAATSAPITDATAEGAVTFIDNSVDPTTGSIKLKATFQNANRQLWPGAFVQVVLNLRNDPAALVIPATAVQASQDGQFVYAVKADRTVEMRPVTVARQQGNEVVIAEGVSAGEEIVTDGQLRLTPGARVMTGRGESGERGGSPGGRSGAATPATPPDGRGRGRL